MQLATEEQMRLAEAAENPAARAVADGRLAVEFSLVALKSDPKSKEAGRPIFEDREWIKIYTPGDKDTVIEREVWPSDKERFPRQYLSFKSNPKGDQIQGMPLADFPAVPPSMVEELRYFGVRTVEQLAAISDGNAQNIGPILHLREKAKEFLTRSREQAPLKAMEGELAKRDAQIEALQRQNADIGSRYEAAMKKMESRLAALDGGGHASPSSTPPAAEGKRSR
jgi:hypothetical protein